MKQTNLNRPQLNLRSTLTIGQLAGWVRIPTLCLSVGIVAQHLVCESEGARSGWRMRVPEQAQNTLMNMVDVC